MRPTFMRQTYKLAAAVMVGLVLSGVMTMGGMARPNEQTVPTAPPPTSNVTQNNIGGKDTYQDAYKLHTAYPASYDATSRNKPDCGSNCCQPDLQT